MLQSFPLISLIPSLGDPPAHRGRQTGGLRPRSWWLQVPGLLFPQQWGGLRASAGGAEHPRGTLVPVPLPIPAAKDGVGTEQPRDPLHVAAGELRGSLRGVRDGSRPGEPPKSKS